MLLARPPLTRAKHSVLSAAVENLKLNVECFFTFHSPLSTFHSPLRKAYSALREPVRLECVMHAASVNPEPGSNSLISSIISALAVTTLEF